MAFDTTFWLRLAARADLCQSAAEQRRLEELAADVMAVVDAVVKQTQAKIQTATDVLGDALATLAEDGSGGRDGEILWPPRDPAALPRLRKRLEQLDLEGCLDEGFLSAVSAQLRKAKEAGDRPGLVVILQRVLQLTAGVQLTQRSYAVRDDSTVDQAELLLERVMTADEEQWADLLREGLAITGGAVDYADLLQAVERRVERCLMRTESGSYQQRVQVEFLKGIEEYVSQLAAAARGAVPLLPSTTRAAP
eukprot:SM000242S08495  [mRNA]  locus=s242:140464:143650:- [translate_table: standard]